LTLVGFGLLGLSASRSPETRKAVPGVALMGLLGAGVLLLSYTSSWPWNGPRAASDAGAFFDAAGHPAFMADGFSLVLKAVFVAGAILCVLMAARFLELE